MGTACARSRANELAFIDAVPKHKAHLINREYIREEKDFPSVQCFAAGFGFLDTNRAADNWVALFADDPLQAHRAGLSQDGRAVARDVVAKAHGI